MQCDVCSHGACLSLTSFRTNFDMRTPCQFWLDKTAGGNSYKISSHAGEKNSNKSYCERENRDMSILTGPIVVAARVCTVSSTQLVG